MEFEFIEYKGNKIALLKSDNFTIQEVQDALDLMADAGTHNSHKIIMNEKHF